MCGVVVVVIFLASVDFQCYVVFPQVNYCYDSQNFYCIYLLSFNYCCVYLLSFNCLIFYKIIIFNLKVPMILIR